MRNEQMTVEERLEISKAYLEEIKQTDEIGATKLMWILDNAEILIHAVEQAELTKYFAKQNGDFHLFLRANSEPKHLGKSDTDVAMEIITEQAERVQELERTESEFLYSSKYLLEQNKRYREAIERIKGAPRKAHSGSDCAGIIFEIIEELEGEE